MNFGNTSIWVLGALVAVFSVALAPNAFATGPDNGPNYHDGDGDGMPDDSDPCPKNPDPTCSGQICERSTITGDGSVFTGEKCRYKYGGNPVQCPDGTYAPTVADCPTGGADSDASSGGGSGGSGGGGSGANGDQEATPEPPAPPPLGTAQATVEGCAAAKPNYTNRPEA